MFDQKNKGFSEWIDNLKTSEVVNTPEEFLIYTIKVFFPRKERLNIIWKLIKSLSK